MINFGFKQVRRSLFELHVWHEVRSCEISSYCTVDPKAIENYLEVRHSRSVKLLIALKSKGEIFILRLVKSLNSLRQNLRKVQNKLTVENGQRGLSGAANQQVNFIFLSCSDRGTGPGKGERHS